jgi:hypothetical protein
MVMEDGPSNIVINYAQENMYASHVGIDGEVMDFFSINRDLYRFAIISPDGNFFAIFFNNNESQEIVEENSTNVAVFDRVNNTRQDGVIPINISYDVSLTAGGNIYFMGQTDQSERSSLYLFRTTLGSIDRIHFGENVDADEFDVQYFIASPDHNHVIVVGRDNDGNYQNFVVTHVDQDYQVHVLRDYRNFGWIDDKTIRAVDYNSDDPVNISIDLLS